MSNLIPKEKPVVHTMIGEANVCIERPGKDDSYTTDPALATCKHCVAVRLLTEALAKLGGDYNEALATVTTSGVRGIKVSSCHCLMARWFSQETGLFCQMGNPFIVIGEGRARLPEYVQKLVSDFDAGRLPALVDQRYRGLAYGNVPLPE